MRIQSGYARALSLALAGSLVWASSAMYGARLGGGCHTVVALN